jgi:hypothetical protein
MSSPSAAIDAIFSRPRGATAILFLIEDSCYMAPLWQRLEGVLPPISPQRDQGCESLRCRESLRSPSPSLTDRYPSGRGVVDELIGTRSV